jgi:hypothetical protein
VALIIGIVALLAGVGLLEASRNRPGILKTSAAFFLIIAIVFIIGWSFGIFNSLSELMSGD